jgi:hypothetical protein
MALDCPWSNPFRTIRLFKDAVLTYKYGTASSLNEAHFKAERGASALFTCNRR